MRYGIGDVVMELPLVESLRRALPEAELMVLGAHPAIELFAGDERIQRCVSIQQLGLTHRWDRGSTATRHRIEGWLRDAGVDLILDSRHAPPAVAVAAYASGIPIVDSDPDVERAAVAAGANAVAAIQAAAAAGWGVEISAERRKPRYVPQSEHRRFADDLLDAAAADVPKVGLAPIASHTLKRWPVERFAQLAAWLCDETRAHLLVFCGPDDRVGRTLLEHVREPDRCTPIEALHLAKVSALVARCEVLVANDTGLTHVAAAVGTPTVGIFGPTAPQIYGPAGDATVGIVGESIECRHRKLRSLEPPDCWFADRCLLGGPGCIHGVEVEAVQQAVRDVLSIRGRRVNRRAAADLREPVSAQRDPS